MFSGFLKVPADGDYEFIIDSDDGSRLTVGDKVVVEHDGIHGDGDPRRGKVRLEAGRVPIRLDYFQGMHGKSLKVAWSGPGFKVRMLSNEPREKVRQLRVADAIRAHGERLLGAEAKRDYDRKLAALEKLKREHVPVEMGLVVSENGPKAPDTFVFYRGNPHADKKPENRVDPAFPAVLRGPRPEISAPAGTETTGRRLA
ncbi:MAG: PA14 domain-containing protein, partial [bacterium]